MENNKTLLVTGASSDVGMGLIRKIHGNYGKILAHYNNSKDGILELQTELGDKIVPMQADFSDEASTKEFAVAVVGHNSPPAHYVHVPARPLINEKFSKLTWDDFEAELTVSFRSAVILCEILMPVMVKNKSGKIVFMLSFNVINHPQIKYAIQYTSAKYALLGLMKGLSAEYANKGITVNAVSPSMIETKFLKKVPDLIKEKNAEASPLKRNLLVSDVVDTFEFLLSDGANCITGQNIAVTGGN